MKLIRFTKLFTIFFLIFSTLGVVRAVTLEDGVIFHANPLAPMNVHDFDLTAPDNSISLKVEILNGSGDLDLWLKYGSPVVGNTVGEMDDNADIFTVSPNANEVIFLDLSSNPVFKPGKWYVSVLNWNQNITSYDLLVTIKKESSSPSSPSTPPVLTGDGGIPAIAIIDKTLITMNFDNSFEFEDVHDLQATMLPLISQYGGQDAVATLKSEDILALGFDGDKLHNLAVSVLPDFQTYYQVDIDKQTISLGNIIRIDSHQWDEEYPAGQFMGALEVSETMPLEEMLGLLSAGTRYIKIKTSVFDTGVEYIRMEFFYQETLNSSSIFIGSIEITGLLIKNIFDGIENANTNASVEGLPQESKDAISAIMDSIVVTDPLPLEDLLSLLTDGTRYIKVNTVEFTTSSGEDALRVSVYFQATTSSPSLLLLTAEIVL